MGKTTEAQHRVNARRYIEETNRAHAKVKEGRQTALSSVKEQMVQKTIHKIEAEIEQKGLRVPKSVFTGFARPWKKK